MDETMTIERLDRSKPPPGCSEAFELPHVGCYHVRTPRGLTNCADSPGGAVALAWAHHEAQNDPPGVRLVWEPDDVHFEPLGAGEWHVEVDDPNGRVTHVVWFAAFASQADVVVDGRTMSPSDVARAASWRWYWLADGGEVLEVLR